MSSVKKEKKKKKSFINCYYKYAIGNLRNTNIQHLCHSFLLFKHALYKTYKVRIYSHNNCFLISIQKDPWVI